MLQDAFMATMKDADFLADAKKQKLNVKPHEGAYLAALIQKNLRHAQADRGQDRRADQVAGSEPHAHGKIVTRCVDGLRIIEATAPIGPRRPRSCGRGAAEAAKLARRLTR